ncbi:MAG: hypothetical protein JXB13_17325 [Phycisphaerae bacterium]|nr:hypothetical protein [Phycisphaerae bacterium]
MGLAGLALDRVLLRSQGGPAAASAGLSPSAAPGSPLPATDLPAGSAAPQEAPVTQCLNRLWSDKEVDFERVRNPFSLPSSWSNLNEKPARTPLDAGEVFAGRHQLTAVVLDGPRSYVLIDDRLLRPGQEIDGFRLVTVEDRAALFEGTGTRVRLELADL